MRKYPEGFFWIEGKHIALGFHCGRCTYSVLNVQPDASGIYRVQCGCGGRVNVYTPPTPKPEPRGFERVREFFCPTVPESLPVLPVKWTRPALITLP